jgi:hypothetical protein
MATKAEELVKLDSSDGCLGRSQDDEPVFILVARDRAAAATVRDWVHRAITLGTPADSPKITEALAIAAQMETWRQNHGNGKVPD